MMGLLELFRRQSDASGSSYGQDTDVNTGDAGADVFLSLIANPFQSQVSLHFWFENLSLTQPAIDCSDIVLRRFDMVLRCWRSSILPLLYITATHRLDICSSSKTRRRKTCPTSNYFWVFRLVAHTQGCQGARASWKDRIGCCHIPPLSQDAQEHLHHPRSFWLCSSHTNQSLRARHHTSIWIHNWRYLRLHPNDTSIHLWHHLLGICHIAICLQRHHILLFMVQLPSGYEAEADIL